MSPDTGTMDPDTGTMDPGTGGAVHGDSRYAVTGVLAAEYAHVNGDLGAALFGVDEALEDGEVVEQRFGADLRIGIARS